jgi:hypothetical protein
MGLRATFGRQLKKTLARFSGEYSAVAPGTTLPFERNLGEDDTRQVVRARLERPRAGAAPEPDDG